MTPSSSPPANRSPTGSTTASAEGALAKLFHHRWSAPVLVALLDAGQARLVPLINSLGVSRNSLKATIAALEHQELAHPNPGYGHPLRPEIALTSRGRAVATACSDYIANLGDSALLARKWTAPLLVAVMTSSHFNELQARLDVTPRALSSALHEVLDAGLIVRTVDDGHPPRSSYALSASGASVASAAEAVGRALQTSGE